MNLQELNLNQLQAAWRWYWGAAMSEAAAERGYNFEAEKFFTQRMIKVGDEYKARTGDEVDQESADRLYTELMEAKELEFLPELHKSMEA